MSKDDGQLLRAFVAQQDKASFEELVRRHGPMVLRVCKRVLGNESDAEDAFQATFLVLSMKAASVRRKKSVASWLYGTAFRTALKLKTRSSLRSARERQAGEMNKQRTDPEQAWNDIRPILDEELNRLPGKYREPVVLCYLQGKTNEEAAQALGWTKGTVSGRLARARELLRARLGRRGATLPAGILAALLLRNAGGGALTESLVLSASQAAGAAGLASAGAVSAQVSSLAQGVMKMMFWTKIKVAGVLLAVTTFTAAAGVVITQGIMKEDSRKKPVETAVETPPTQLGYFGFLEDDPEESTPAQVDHSLAGGTETEAGAGAQVADAQIAPERMFNGVEAGLKWLLGNQNADGSWDSTLSGGQAQELHYGTSMALLAFLGAGHTEKHGQYRDHVRRGVRWLISQQHGDGRIGPDGPMPDTPLARFQRMRIHAASTLLLAEAYGMGQVPATKAAAQKALNWLSSARMLSGLKRTENAMDDDVAAVGWFLIAWKSGQVAGLEVKGMPAEAKAYLDSREVGAAVGHTHRYAFFGERAKGLDTMVGINGRLFSGTPARQVQPGIDWCFASEGKGPSWGSEGEAFDWYYAYFGSLACFRAGGGYWQTWNTVVRGLLTEQQNKDGDALHGSWNPVGTFEDRGRVLPTALGALCLEVYYRYLPSYR